MPFELSSHGDISYSEDDMDLPGPVVVLSSWFFVMLLWIAWVAGSFWMLCCWLDREDDAPHGDHVFSFSDEEDQEEDEEGGLEDPPPPYSEGQAPPNYATITGDMH